MHYDGEYIHNFLVEDGTPLEDYFIVDDLIMNLSTLDDETVPMALVIEDDDLNEACVAYLKEQGARQFDSMDQVQAWIESKGKTQ
jgi:hypothetical protein